MEPDDVLSWRRSGHGGSLSNMAAVRPLQGDAFAVSLYALSPRERKALRLDDGAVLRLNRETPQRPWRLAVAPNKAEWSDKRNAAYAALTRPLFSPTFGNIAMYVLAPHEICDANLSVRTSGADGTNDHSGVSTLSSGAAAATTARRMRPLSVAAVPALPLPASADASALPGDRVYADLGRRRDKWTSSAFVLACRRGFGRFFAFLASILLLPITAIFFVCTVVASTIRSVRSDVNARTSDGSAGVTMGEHGAFAAIMLLFAVALAASILLPLYVSARVNWQILSWTYIGCVVLLTVPSWVFLGRTTAIPYWNEVPGGLTRRTFRWTWANARTMLALVFSAAQLASFAIVRLDRLLHFATFTAKSTEPVGILPTSLTGAGDEQASLNATVVQVEYIIQSIVGLIPLDADTVYVAFFYGAVAACGLWISLLALPISQQLFLVWWRGALYASTLTSGSAQQQQPDHHLESGVPSPPPATVTLAVLRSGPLRLWFNLTAGGLFGRQLYGVYLHGFMQYLLGDMLFVTITAVLLRSAGCVPCVEDNVDTGCFGSIPGMVCWTSPRQVVFAVVGYCALTVYLFTATFATPLMASVLERSRELDIRTTPRFAISDRLSQIVILAGYTLITTPAPPIAVHAVVSCAMVVYVEYTRPASDRTVLLRSCLYQLNLCIAASVLLAFFRVLWLPLVAMAGTVVIVLFITLVRFILLRRILATDDIRRAIHGLGQSTEALDDEGVVSVRKQRRLLLRNADECWESGDSAGALELLKRALFNGGTQAEAACRIATLIYQGRVAPRYLLNCLRLTLLLSKQAAYVPHFDARQRRLLQTLWILCALEFRIELGDTFAAEFHTLKTQRETQPRSLDPYSWCLLGLMYERLGFVGAPALIVNRKQLAALATLHAADYHREAFLCMQTGASQPDSYLPTLHLARYLADGVGCEANANAATDLLQTLAAHDFHHAHYYIGQVWMRQANVTTTVARPVRQRWSEYALAAWKIGCQRGDLDCIDQLAAAAAAHATVAGRGARLSAASTPTTPVATWHDHGGSTSSASLASRQDRLTPTGPGPSFPASPAGSHGDGRERSNTLPSSVPPPSYSDSVDVLIVSSPAVPFEPIRASTSPGLQASRVDVAVPSRVDVAVSSRVDVAVPSRVDVAVPRRVDVAVPSPRELQASRTNMAPVPSPGASSPDEHTPIASAATAPRTKSTKRKEGTKKKRSSLPGSAGAIVPAAAGSASTSTILHLHVIDGPITTAGPMADAPPGLSEASGPIAVANAGVAAAATGVNAGSSTFALAKTSKKKTLRRKSTPTELAVATYADQSTGSLS